MDPLSITTATMALMQVAASITTTLSDFVIACRTADTLVSNLCHELTHLTSCLQAVDSVMKGCRPSDLELMEQELWHQCEVAIMDCQTTLGELSILVEKIKNHAKAKKFAWRAKVAIDFSIYEASLAVFRDRIFRSNSALQTMLHAINVSSSLRNRDSHGEILIELGKLKQSIERARQASRNIFSPGHLSPNSTSDIPASIHLRELVEAANDFHVTASSTASTIPDGSTTMSSHGNLTPYRRERVELYLHDTSVPLREDDRVATQAVVSRRSSLVGGFSGLGTPHNHLSTPLNPAGSPHLQHITQIRGSFYLDEEAKRMRLDILEEDAKEEIRNCDYAGAIDYLKKAIENEIDPRPTNANYRRLQEQVIVCYFLQHEWQLAKPIIAELAGSYNGLDPIICNFLHALALTYLSEFSFDKALSFCNQALQGKKKLAKQFNRDLGETLGLLTFIFEMMGDYTLAEIHRRQCPADFIYTHPSSAAEFIRNHPTLLKSLLGDFAPSVETGSDPRNGQYSDPVAAHAALQGLGTPHRAQTVTRRDISAMRLRISALKRVDKDGSKVFVSAGDVQAPDSAIDVSPISPITAQGSEAPAEQDKVEPALLPRRRISRFFGPRDESRVPRSADQDPQQAQEGLSSKSPGSRWFRGGGVIRKPTRFKISRRRRSDDMLTREKKQDLRRWFWTMKKSSDAPAVPPQPQGSDDSAVPLPSPEPDDSTSAVPLQPQGPDDIRMPHELHDTQMPYELDSAATRHQELQDTSLGPVEIVDRYRNFRNLAAASSNSMSISDSGSENTASPSGTREPYDRPTMHVAVCDIQSLLGPCVSFGISDLYSDLDLDEMVPEQGATWPDEDEDEDEDENEDEDNARCVGTPPPNLLLYSSPEPIFHDFRQPIIASSSSNSTDMIGRITTILAALPRADTVEDRGSAKDELENVLGDCGPRLLATDPLLHSDLRRILELLQSSGGESTGSGEPGGSSVKIGEGSSSRANAISPPSQTERKTSTNPAKTVRWPFHAEEHFLRTTVDRISRDEYYNIKTPDSAFSWTKGDDIATRSI